MKDFKIWCETEEEKQKVLAKMESEGILWSSGHKPTDWNVNNMSEGFNVIDKKLYLYYGRRASFEAKPLPEITVEEYLNKGEREMQEFTKTDLKTGHIVTLRNGKEYMVFLNIDTSSYTDCKNILLDVKENSWVDLNNFNESLKYNGFTKTNKKDIVKVERPYHCYCIHDADYSKSERVLLWEETAKEMTIAEIEKILGYPVKIVKEAC